MVILYLLLPLMWLLGVYVAGEKGRSGWEGFILALLFGPFGVLIEALLPRREKAKPPSAGQDDMSDYNEMPLIWNENRIDEADVDKIISG